MKRFVLPIISLAALALAACGGGSGDEYAARLRGESPGSTMAPAPTHAPVASDAAPTPAPPPTVAPVVLAVIPTVAPPTVAPIPMLLPTTTPYIVPTPTPAAPVGVCHYEWRDGVRYTIFCPEGVTP
jgi:hypothetical protein